MSDPSKGKDKSTETEEPPPQGIFFGTASLRDILNGVVLDVEELQDLECVEVVSDGENSDSYEKPVSYRREGQSGRAGHTQPSRGSTAIWDVGHYGKSLYLQNSESSNCMVCSTTVASSADYAAHQIFTYCNLRRRRT